MTVLYKYTYVQKHSSCANLLPFKNVRQVPFLPIPRWMFKACIKMNFGVGKLLYVLSHTVFLASIYIFTKIDPFTEPYRSVHFKIHNAVVWVPRSQKTKGGLRCCKETTRESQYVEKKERKAELASLGWQIIIHNFHGSAVGLIIAFYTCLCVGPCRSSLASCLAHYFQMYNAIVSKCFGKKDLERNHEVLTKIEICNKAK